MPKKPTIAFLAGAFALVSFSAFAIDIPDYGSKNFNPSGDTPTYLTNESAPVSTRTADTTASDWSAEEAAAPVPAAVAPAPSARNVGRHARYATAEKSAKHPLGKSRSMGHSMRSPPVNPGKATKAPSFHNSAAQPRTVSKRPPWVTNARGMAKSGPASAAKTTTAKHGKAGTRHARAAIIHQMTAALATALPKEA